MDNNNPIVVCFYRPNIIQGHLQMLTLLSIWRNSITCAGRQWRHWLCIIQVNTEFFQNDTTKSAMFG